MFTLFNPIKLTRWKVIGFSCFMLLIGVTPLLATYPEMNQTTAYQVLDVNENSSPSEIKKAYYKLARKWHPDKNPNDKKKSEEMFKQITAAYALLTNPKKYQDSDFFGSIFGFVRTFLEKQGDLEEFFTLLEEALAKDDSTINIDKNYSSSNGNLRVYYQGGTDENGNSYVHRGFQYRGQENQKENQKKYQGLLITDNEKLNQTIEKMCEKIEENALPSEERLDWLHWGVSRFVKMKNQVESGKIEKAGYWRKTTNVYFDLSEKDKNSLLTRFQDAEKKLIQEFTAQGKDYTKYDPNNFLASVNNGLEKNIDSIVKKMRFIYFAKRAAIILILTIIIGGVLIKVARYINMRKQIKK